MAIVLSCGMQTLLEDLKGRCGYMDIGVSRSGMLDDYAGRLLNALVGNDDQMAAIEIVGGGFTLEFQEETVIAVGGAKLPVTLNDSELPPYTAVAVQPGDVLKTGRFSKETRGFRQYVAVAGGVAADSYLGSTRHCHLRQLRRLPGPGPPERGRAHPGAPDRRGPGRCRPRHPPGSDPGVHQPLGHAGYSRPRRGAGLLHRGGDGAVLHHRVQSPSLL